MKIVGHSTLVSGTPYLHLGYTAATYMKPNQALLGGGFVVLTLGVAMVFSLVVTKTVSGWAAFNIVRRKSKKLLFGGVALIILGCISVALAIAYKDDIPAYPLHMTHINGEVLLREVAELRKQGKPISADPAALGVDRDVMLDGWRIPMRLVKADVDTSEVYSVLSAGADGKFDTDDDVRMFSGPDGSLVTGNDVGPSGKQ